MAPGTGQKAIYSSYNNIIVCNIDGKDLKDATVMAAINKEVENKVKTIIDGLKTSHYKFIDTDFGPVNDDDPAVQSLYASKTPPPSGSKYPRPEDLRWVRPIYDDNHFDEEHKDGDETKEIEGEDAGGEVDSIEDIFGDELDIALPDSGDDCFSKHGCLFIDGASSGDVIQGMLGDCWFLGALAVMGANENLLKDCFWNADNFKNYGLFVVRFIKGVNMMFVVIDDRIPVKRKDGKIVFAMCKDPNELWVPLIEKAYAKLHGSYKALIGGYSHIALSDMTGFCPKLVTLKPGFPGYSEKYDANEVWSMLERYKSWGCLMGTSIQSNPKDDKKVESEAGMGLHMGHAYSFLGLGTIDDKSAPEGHVKLVKLRNPWGRGEWEGAYGDRTDERERDDIQAEIEKNFKVGHEDITINFMDGSFFMPFEAWLSRFTNLFVALAFPPTWTGKRTHGFWSGESGGNREMGSWISNNKIKFKLDAPAGAARGGFHRVFVGLYTTDSRLYLGADYYKDPLYSTPLAFDIVTSEQFDKPAKERTYIAGSSKDLPDAANPAKPVLQAAYMYGSTQIECFLQDGQDYYIVPFLSKRGQAGAYYVTAYADTTFDLEGGAKVSGESSLMVVGEKSGDAVKAAHAGDKGVHWNNTDVVLEPGSVLRDAPASESKFQGKDSAPATQKVLTISKAQFYEKAEQLRARFVSESKRLGVSLAQMINLFASDIDDKGEMKRASYAAFKRRLMDIGFSLTDLPDEDLVVLDIDNSGSISPPEFLAFFEQGLRFDESENMPMPPPPPVDDLLFKAADLEGVLRVKVVAGRAMRQPACWFNDAPDDENKSNVNRVNMEKTRKVLHYNVNDQKKVYDNLFHTFNPDGTAVKNANKRGSTPQLSSDTQEDEIDDELESPTKHAPNSPNMKRTGTSIHSGISISSTIKRQGETAAHDSGIKLHNDKDLIEAESKRALQLQNLRKTLLSEDSAAVAASELEKNGALRKRQKTRFKVEKRNIRKDASALGLLNKQPDLVLALIDGPDPYPVARAAYAREGRKGKDCPIPAPPALAGAQVTVQGRPGLLQKQATAMYGERNLNLFESKAFVMSDLWDVLIERVIIISDSRIGTRSLGGTGISLQAALYDLKGRKGWVERDVFSPFLAGAEVTKSAIMTPKVGTDKAVRKGTTPTPRNMKKFPGWASVTTAQNKANFANQAAVVKEAMDKIKETQKGNYYEIYRRLVCIPCLNLNDVEGDRQRHSSDDSTSASYLSAFAKRLFSKFDKNMNGTISLEEFKESLLEMNINVSDEDSLTLFNRFETREKDGTIDWQEFLDFFHTHIVSDMCTDWDADGKNDTKERSILDVLLDIRANVAPAVKEMVEKGWQSLDEYFRKTQTGRRGSILTGARSSQGPSQVYTGDPALSASHSTQALKPGQSLPDNCIFHHLNTGHSNRNVMVLRQFGVKVDIDDMKRINRVFGRNVSAFMTFISGSDSVRLGDVMKEVHRRVIAGFESRVGLNNACDFGSSLTSAAINKLWSILCHEKSSLKFDEMVDIVYDIVSKSMEVDDIPHPLTKPATPRSASKSRPENTEHKSRSRTASDDEGGEDEDGTKNWSNATFMGIHVELVARCATDYIAQSAWNKAVTGDKGANNTNNAMSYSAFEAYIRFGHISAIEAKLKYLLQLEMSIAGPRMYSLVHVYMNHAQTEAIVLVHEPLSGDISSIVLTEDFTSLPNPDKLNELFKAKCLEHGLASEKYSAAYQYNPWDTPGEDTAISNVVGRLRIVRTASAKCPNQLIMAEDSKFVSQINALLDAATDLPFFCTCSDTSLYFEIDSKDLGQHGEGIKPLVFGSIRKSKSLHSYLTNVMANLNVILTSYNAGVRINMPWKEMLAHLTDYRNPYLTAELKPKFLEPNEYVYRPFESTEAFNGEEDNDPLQVQTSVVVTDGGTHPAFNASFAIKFRPPKLTACKLLATEIHKMVVDGEAKFVIVMAREAKRVATNKALKPENESFLFLTIYDPRSATDYQCGVKEPDPKSANLKQRSCDLYKVLVEADDDESSSFFNSPAKQSIDRFMKMVSDACDNDMILLGPAITPRLILTVLNQRGRNIEVLGQCQMSISAVLSGSGLGKPAWNTLTYTQDDRSAKSAGKDICVNAGEIQVELGFRKLSEIEDELKAEKNRLQRKKDRGSRVSSLVGTPKERPVALTKRTDTIPEVEPPPAPANTPAIIDIKMTAKPALVRQITDISQLTQSEIDDNHHVQIGAEHNKAILDSQERVLQLETERKNQVEAIAALQKLLADAKAAADAKEAALLARDEAFAAKEAELKAKDEAFAALQASMVLEKGVPKLPVLPSTPVVEKSPRGKKGDKESKSKSSSKDESAGTAGGGMSQAEQAELLELRALKEKMHAEAAVRLEAKLKQDKEMQKMADKLKKQKEAAAKEKAALEEELARETQERLKLASLKEKGKKVVESLSSSAPITLKEKIANSKTQEVEEAQSMSVTGAAVGEKPAPTLTQLARSAALENLSSAEKSPHPDPMELSSSSNSAKAKTTLKVDGGSGAIRSTETSPARASSSGKVDWSKVPLPTGWDSKVDKTTGRTFYVDHLHKTTQWKHPLYHSS